MTLPWPESDATARYERTRLTAPMALVEEYVEELRRRNTTPLHGSMARSRLGRLLVGVSSLVELTPDRIRAILIKLSTTRLRGPRERGRGRVPCPKTLNHYQDTLSALFAWLVKEDRWPQNPVRRIAKARVTAPTRVRRALEIGGLEKLLATAPARRSLVYRVAATTGLRRSELRSLIWADIDLVGASLVVRARFAKNRRDACLPLPIQTLEALRAARGRTSAGRKVFRSIPKIAVVYRDIGRAGIPIDTPEGKVDFHALRVTFATLLARTGATLALTQRLMRHSTPTLMANVYTRLELEDARTAVQAIDAYLAAEASRRASSGPDTQPHDNPLARIMAMLPGRPREQLLAVERLIRSFDAA